MNKYTSSHIHKLEDYCYFLGFEIVFRRMVVALSGHLSLKIIVYNLYGNKSNFRENGCHVCAIAPHGYSFLFISKEKLAEDISIIKNIPCFF